MSNDLIDEKTQGFTGHMTLADGSHVPLSAEGAKALWDECDRLKKKREADMPTERDALQVMGQAYQRLKELGWSEAMYCPKDGSLFEVIEAGSTGIHKCHYEGEWPKGSWWVHADGDLWPSDPILYRKMSEAV